MPELDSGQKLFLSLPLMVGENVCVRLGVDVVTQRGFTEGSWYVAGIPITLVIHHHPLPSLPISPYTGLLNRPHNADK